MATAPQQLEHALEGETKPQGAVSSELNRLAVHASHYLVGLIGSLAFGLISFPIFTRIFSVAEYGLIDLAQKTLLLVWAGSKMGLQNAAVRFYDGARFAVDLQARRRYFSTLFFGIVICGAAGAIVFGAATQIAPEATRTGPLSGMVHLIALLLVFKSIDSILWAFLRVEERTKAFNVVAVATKAATLIAVWLLLPVTGRTAQTYFIGMVGVEAALVLSLTIPLLKRRVLQPKAMDFGFLRASILYGGPLVLFEFAFNTLGSVDRFLVRHFLGADALGLYSVAYGLANHVNELLVTPLSLALMPIYIRIWTTDGREKTIDFLSISFDIFLMAAAGVAALATVCSREVVMLLASSKYAGAEHLIPVLFAGLLIYTSHLFFAAGLLIYKRTIRMAVVLITAAVLNIGLNWTLLPAMGAMGGAIAATLSYLAAIMALSIMSIGLLPVRLNVAHIAGYVVAGGLAWTSTHFLDFGQPVLNLAAKSLLGLIVYCGALYASNQRFRTGVTYAVAHLGLRHIAFAER